jgi:hypothetical protein
MPNTADIYDDFSYAMLISYCHFNFDIERVAFTAAPLDDTIIIEK